MKKHILSILLRGLISLIILGALSLLSLSAFWVGKLEGALNPASNAEKIMCVSREVDIRQSPTGYVIGTVPAGSSLWFIKLDLPFAYVAYYDGSAWLEGSVTASVLELCK
jgi:hypothetical protein